MRAEDKIPPLLDVPAATGGAGASGAPIVAQLAAPRGTENSQPLARVVETAVAVPESDPERVAFNLWNSGQIDEAIQFLEHEIAAERARAPSRRTLSQARRKILGDKAEAMFSASDPVMERQKRRLRALGAADFSATGAPVGQIDLVAVPADQVVPAFTRQRRVWPLAAALCLLTVFGLAGANYYYGADGARTELALPAATPDEPTATASLPAASTATVTADTTASAEDAFDPEEIVELPPEVDADGIDEAPPAEDFGDDAALPGEADDAAAAEPVESPAAADSAPPEEVAALEPEAVRLPRQRPEPPAAALEAASRPASVEEPTVPLVLGAPPATLQPPRPLVGRPLPVFGPPPAEDPDFEQRATLTPEEHQRLLERRALAEDYAARQRALADEDDAFADEDDAYANEDDREFRIIGRALPRWRRLGF
jgi:hypothetical protein